MSIANIRGCSPGYPHIIWVIEGLWISCTASPLKQNVHNLEKLGIGMWSLYRPTPVPTGQNWQPCLLRVQGGGNPKVQKPLGHQQFCSGLPVTIEEKCPVHANRLVLRVPLISEKPSDVGHQAFSIHSSSTRGLGVEMFLSHQSVK